MVLYYMYLCVMCFLSRNIKFFHVDTHSSTWVIFPAVQYSTTVIYCGLFIRSPLEGYLCCFQHLVLAMLMWTSCTGIILAHKCESFLGRIGTTRSQEMDVFDFTRYCSPVSVQIYMPTSNMWKFWSFHILNKTILSTLNFC